MLQKYFLELVLSSLITDFRMYYQSYDDNDKTLAPGESSTFEYDLEVGETEIIVDYAKATVVK